MNTSAFCQSCSMPLSNPELLGTEKDGSKSHEYCIYCYQNGAFINPATTLAEMKVIVQEQMEKRKIASGIIKDAINMLPGLKRWQKAAAKTV